MKNLEVYLAFCHKQIPYGKELEVAVDGLKMAVKLKQHRQSQRSLAYVIIQSVPDVEQRKALLAGLADSMFPGMGMKKLGDGKIANSK